MLVEGRDVIVAWGHVDHGPTTTITTAMDTRTIMVTTATTMTTGLTTTD